MPFYLHTYADTLISKIEKVSSVVADLHLSTINMPKIDDETDSLQKELKALVEKIREKCKNVRDSADLGSGSR